MDLDLGSIGGMLTRILPLFDYYITFFTKVLTNFAASLGFDLALPGEGLTPDEPSTEEAVQ